MYQTIGKRILDLLTAAIALVLLSPILITLTLMIALCYRCLPFFLQQRVGRGERLFTLIKFRTMAEPADSTGRLLSDSERLTGLGNFIRSTGIDLLPQLINVIKGDLSLVGPRPLIPKYLSLFNDTQRLRHTVRPGLTGAAQVYGAELNSWPEIFAYDVSYAQNFTFVGDLRIISLAIRHLWGNIRHHEKSIADPIQV
jgi:lipopolysaccharide/colanic/teichoic acid biosynthesis glycosyltransferase